MGGAPAYPPAPSLASGPTSDPAVALMRFKPKVPALGSIAQTDPG